jgi:hypothetical protein
MDLIGIPQEFLARLSDDGKQLMLTGMHLTAVPDRVGILTALTTLDLSGNQLTTGTCSAGRSPGRRVHSGRAGGNGTADLKFSPSVSNQRRPVFVSST